MRYFFGISGRYNRLQWWLTQLVLIVIYIFAAAALSHLSGQKNENPTGTFGLVLLLIVALGSLWLNICASIKRYHDRGKSGWWYMIVIVPVIGPIWQLVELGFLSGEEGRNIYDINYDDPEEFLPKASSPTKTAGHQDSVTSRVITRQTASEKPSFGKRK
jgi:uncharacterized membrane protein YhaH (DUF805 family)